MEVLWLNARAVGDRAVLTTQQLAGVSVKLQTFIPYAQQKSVTRLSFPRGVMRNTYSRSPPVPNPWGWGAPSSITTGRKKRLTIRLGNTQTKPHLPLRHIRQKSLLLLLISPVDDRRNANPIPSSQSPHHAGIPYACEFICNDEGVEVVPFFSWDAGGERDSDACIQPTAQRKITKLRMSFQGLYSTD